MVHSPSLHLGWGPLSHNEADKRADEKDDKQHIGDLGRRPCDARDPQETRDQPDDKKCNGPAQHNGTSFDEN